MDTSLSVEIRAEIKAAVREALAEFGNTDTLAYTVRTLAKATDAGPTTVRAEIRAGRLKARRWGDKLIIPAPDARAFVASLPEAQAT